MQAPTFDFRLLHFNMSIESNNIFYDLIRRYMNAMFRTSYSKIEYVGLEKIPRDGALIFAPNHTNALMDALTVLTANRAKVVFVSRADIFRKPLVAKILNFFKIMPIMRMRDGMANVKKNDEIMHRAVHVLCSGVPFCIFSEGTHRMKHSLLPLTKGIFRIALQCVEASSSEKAPAAIAGKKVYILPLGIEYGSYTRYRHSLLVNVGEAIDVSRFVSEHSGLETPEMINALRPVLAEHMSRTFFCVPDEWEQYQGVVDLSYLRNSELLAEGHAPGTLYNTMLANRRTIDEIESWKETDAAAVDELLAVMDEYASERNRLNIDDSSLYRQPTMKSLFFNVVTAVLFLPYALYCMAVDAPVAFVQWLFTHSLEDRAFANSFRFVVVMLFYPIVVLVVAILLFCNTSSWVAASIAVIFTIGANAFANDYWMLLRHIVSDWKYLRSKKLNLLWSKAKDVMERLKK